MTIPAILVGYGYEPHFAATHLDRALRDFCRVDSVGTGNEGSWSNIARATPFLWIDTPTAWIPPEELVEEHLSIAWLINTHQDTGRWRLGLASMFDFVFAVQVDALAALKRQQIPSAWMPLAAPRELLPDTFIPFGDRTYDVGFVGVAVPGTPRYDLIHYLSKRFVMPELRRRSPEEMMQLYGNCRTVVNLPAGHDLNMRAFEGPGAGSFLVTGPSDGLDQVLPPELYCEVSASDPEAWGDAIARVLGDSDFEDRARMAKDVVRRKHTFHNRAQFLLETVPKIARLHHSAAARQRCIAQALAYRGSLVQIWRLRGIPVEERARHMCASAAWWSGRRLPQPIKNIYARRLVPRLHAHARR